MNQSMQPIVDGCSQALELDRAKEIAKALHGYLWSQLKYKNADHSRGMREVWTTSKSTVRQ